MRVAIVIPPIQDFYTTPHRLTALGARVVSRVLSTCGCTPQLFDFCDTTRPVRVPLPRAYAHLEPFLVQSESGPLSFFSRYYRFGYSDEECGAAVLAFRPDVIMLSCFAYCYADTALRCAHAIKTRLPDCPLCAGGAGPSVHPYYFIENQYVDYVLGGEAEYALPPFIHMLSTHTSPQKVPGLFWKGGYPLSASTYWMLCFPPTRDRYGTVSVVAAC